MRIKTTELTKHEESLLRLALLTLLHENDRMIKLQFAESFTNTLKKENAEVKDLYEKLLTSLNVKVEY